MSRRYDRRELLAAGLALWALPRSGARAEVAGVERAADDLAAAAGWADRALAALRAPGAVFRADGDGAACDLGAIGRLEVTASGEAAVLVTLEGCSGELEILRPLDAPQVARVEARMAEPVAPPAGPCYDTLRRIPGGHELTYSSPLALRHAGPERLATEPPAVYERLAELAVEGARSFLC